MQLRKNINQVEGTRNDFKTPKVKVNKVFY